jgi:hypothetical protein
MMVYPCGAEVILKRVPELPGNITGISIRFTYVQYEVTYYVQGVQYKVLVDENEIIKDSKKVKLGFK